MNDCSFLNKLHKYQEEDKGSFGYLLEELEVLLVQRRLQQALDNELGSCLGNFAATSTDD